MGSEETDKYAVNFEADMHVPSVRLENNFYEAGPFYYRGMALTLEEIADIAKTECAYGIQNRKARSV